MRTFVLLIWVSAFAFGCKPATEPTEPAEPADTAASTDAEAVSPQEVQQVFSVFGLIPPRFDLCAGRAGRSAHGRDFVLLQTADVPHAQRLFVLSSQD